MNSHEFNIKCSQLVSEATRNLTGAEIVAPLISHIANIVALSSKQTNTDPEILIETIRHQLDVSVVHFVETYK